MSPLQACLLYAGGYPRLEWAETRVIKNRKNETAVVKRDEDAMVGYGREGCTKLEVEKSTRRAFIYRMGTSYF